MTVLVLCLASFGFGVLAGASALYWLRDERRTERTPSRYAGIIDHETGDSAFAHPFRRDLEGL